MVPYQDCRKGLTLLKKGGKRRVEGTSPGSLRVFIRTMEARTQAHTSVNNNKGDRKKLGGGWVENPNAWPCWSAKEKTVQPPPLARGWREEGVWAYKKGLEGNCSWGGNRRGCTSLRAGGDAKGE